MMPNIVTEMASLNNISSNNTTYDNIYVKINVTIRFVGLKTIDLETKIVILSALVQKL